MQHTYHMRDPETTRYNTLIEFIKGIYADHIVTPAEQQHMETMCDDILYEYQMAANMRSTLAQDDPLKQTLDELTAHLQRCYFLLDFARDKGRVYNTMTSMEKNRAAARMQTKETLEISNLSLKEMALMLSLTNPKERQEVLMNEAAKAAEKLPPDKRQALESFVHQTLEAMRRSQINEAQMNRLLGFDRER